MVVQNIGFKNGGVVTGTRLVEFPVLLFTGIGYGSWIFLVARGDIGFG
jgi:hypothetical protein